MKITFPQSELPNQLTTVFSLAPSLISSSKLTLPVCGGGTFGATLVTAGGAGGGTGAGGALGAAEIH